MRSQTGDCNNINFQVVVSLSYRKCYHWGELEEGLRNPLYCCLELCVNLQLSQNKICQLFKINNNIKIEWGETDGDPRNVTNKNGVFKNFSVQMHKKLHFWNLKESFFFFCHTLKSYHKIKRHYLYSEFQPQAKSHGRWQPIPK